MMHDIKRIRKDSRDEKILTKQEWMIAAISALEKLNGTELNEENSGKLY